MAKTLNEMLAELPPERRSRVHARTQELIAEEMTLSELRKVMGKTQTQLARLTGKPQATISRMEQQSDMLISTLDQVVGALGGRVRIVAELPNRRPVLLTGLGDIGAPPSAASPVLHQVRASKARSAPLHRRASIKASPKRHSGRKPTSGAP